MDVHRERLRDPALQVQRQRRSLVGPVVVRHPVRLQRVEAFEVQQWDGVATAGGIAAEHRARILSDREPDAAIVGEGAIDQVAKGCRGVLGRSRSQPSCPGWQGRTRPEHHRGMMASGCGRLTGTAALGVLWHWISLVRDRSAAVAPTTPRWGSLGGRGGDRSRSAAGGAEPAPGLRRRVLRQRPPVVPVGGHSRTRHGALPQRAATRGQLDVDDRGHPRGSAAGPAGTAGGRSRPRARCPELAAFHRPGVDQRVRVVDRLDHPPTEPGAGPRPGPRRRLETVFGEPPALSLIHICRPW